jgi:hypothetical protein
MGPGPLGPYNNSKLIIGNPGTRTRLNIDIFSLGMVIMKPGPKWPNPFPILNNLEVLSSFSSFSNLEIKMKGEKQWILSSPFEHINHNGRLNH